MKVFFRPLWYTESRHHLLVSYRWEKDTTGKQMMAMRAQFFCEDAGNVYHKVDKFTIEDYNREKHLKKLCPDCVLKIKKSKRYAPQINPS